MEKKQTFRSSNISSIFISTSIAMTITELAGVLTGLIDGIISGRFLDIYVFSGISLLKPLSRIVSIAGVFLSAGSSIVCSRLVGSGKKQEAVQVFNLCILLGVLFSGLLTSVCLLSSSLVFRLCGVSLTKYPELIVHMKDYLRGYLIGIPAQTFCQIAGPVLVMDSGKEAYTRSSIVLCVTDIAADLLNVFAFHGGAFGMGLATSLSHIAQLLVLLPLLLGKGRYFHLSLNGLSLNHLPEIVVTGSPAFTKRLAVAFKESVLNYLNITVALSAAAIAARSIQNDLSLFFFSIASGMAGTIVTLTSIYYGADDRKGLVYLFSFALKFGITLIAVLSAATFVFAPLAARLYTSDTEVLSLAVFAIRWMCLSLVFDVISDIVQHYLHGIGDVKRTNALTIIERFVSPIVCAIVMGSFFGSKGMLASMFVDKFLLFVIMFLAVLIHLRRLPRSWEDLMFLPDSFGKDQDNNMYARMACIDDAIKVSEETRGFCHERGADKKQANLIALFVEELAVNVFEHAQKKNRKAPAIDYRLMIDEETIRFTMSDLAELFDPTLFYELHKYDSPEEHIGIRLVMKAAEEVRYYSTFNSNNLTVTLKRSEG